MQNEWHTGIFATLEEKQELACWRGNSGGGWLGDSFPGCALPHKEALGRWILIRCGSIWTCAQVVDVGPFCIDDSPYVFGMSRPRAETLKGMICTRTLDGDDAATVPDGKGGFKPAPVSNGAGIDLFPRTAMILGLKDNAVVDWRWVV